MGRRLYLERLALGRSAFEDPVLEPSITSQEASEDSTAVASSQQNDEDYQQQYDNKGRPIKLSTEEINRSMRNAQNAVLALVGVVESKDDSDSRAKEKYRLLHESREAILAAEQERGEEVEALTGLIHRISTWWPETLTSRIQAGLYSTTLSFTHVVRQELGAAKLGGYRGLLAVAFPGAPTYLAYTVTKTLLCGSVAEGMGLLQEKLGRRFSRHKMRLRVHTIINVACDILFLTIDVALLPLQYHAEVQALGLAPAWPLLPSWRVFLPPGISPAQSFLWSSPFRVPVLGRLCSPAIMLLLLNYLKRDMGDEKPIASQFTSFRYPTFNARPNTAPRICRDQLGAVLYHCYALRRGLLRWFGWKLEYVTPVTRPDKGYENNYLFEQGLATWNDNEPHSDNDEHEHLPHFHRSTALAHGPVMYLAQRIDNCFVKLLMLPLESLAMKAVTHSYLASTLPKTALAITATSHYYSPFGRGLVGSIRSLVYSSDAWKRTFNYLSKLGLSLSLQCATEIGVFFALYTFTRWQGVRNYNYGNAMPRNVGQMGTIIYRTPNERPSRDRP